MCLLRHLSDINNQIAYCRHILTSPYFSDVKMCISANIYIHNDSIKKNCVPLHD